MALYGFFRYALITPYRAIYNIMLLLDAVLLPAVMVCGSMGVLYPFLERAAVPVIVCGYRLQSFRLLSAVAVYGMMFYKSIYALYYCEAFKRLFKGF